jgi:hypothetical protein
MADRVRSRNDVGQPALGPATAYWGLAFVVLLLVSAGMVTLPGERNGVAFVRDFYEDNPHHNCHRAGDRVGGVGSVPCLCAWAAA